MNLSALAKPAGPSFSGRFFLVSTLPTTLAGTCLLVLVWAGAPGPVRFGRAWRTAAGLGVGPSLLLLLFVTAVGVITMPLQLPLVRWLEGYWPRRLERLARWCRARQESRCGNATRTLTREEALDPEVVEREFARGYPQRLRYPVDRPHLFRPTALGNALTAAESRAGRAYGMDAPVFWTRLEPLLSGRIAATVTEQRDAMDAAARLSVTAALCVPPTVWLLWRSGWWLLLAALLAVLSRLAYVAAVHAAVAYGQYVEAAFDLHRFDLLSALHLPLPDDREEEQRSNEDLGGLWRQGLPPRSPLRYVHPAVPEDPPPPASPPVD
ncbi:hypothetical protein AB5J72_43905 [Streptomyces sp. CG1]|uniref:hypothetical protein n=1 Tax=Streptomyces sp. CG1 TaxID=1287523 RepID=UPI0034E3030C